MQARDALTDIAREFGGIDPARVYVDILATAAASWCAYVYLVLQPLDVSWWAMFIVAVASFYRGVSFSHEVSHLRTRLNWLKPMYNLFFGYPHRVPAYMLYPHRFHHRVNTFATNADPEYERWTDSSPWVLLRPFVVAAFFPVYATLRMGVWPWLLLLLPKRYSEKTYRHASTIVMNVRYERPMRDGDLSEMIRQDLFCAGWFVLFCAVTVAAGVFGRALLVWVFMAYVATLTNTYRALVAHRYRAHRNPNATLEGQLADSVTIEGDLWTRIWAPIGLNYHSTHHLLPSIPYYNLAKAHDKLKHALPHAHPYWATIEPSFASAMLKMVRTCRRSVAHVPSGLATTREGK